MLDFNILTPKELSEIINNKTNVQFIATQTLTKTNGIPQKTTHQYSMPTLSKSDIEQILANSVMTGNEIQTRWITFITFVHYLNGEIYYVNVDNLECVVTIKF